MKEIYFITGNKGKYKEAKEKLSKINIEVIQKNLGYPEIQAPSLEDVASFGVKFVEKIFDKPFILEDAGLFIDEFDGFPGVYSAYVYHTIGCKGILKLLENKKNRSATFKSVFAYGLKDQEPELFIGTCTGTISKEEKGKNGFGYDPIFTPDNEKITFAEMKINQKNNFSHRGKSLEKVIDFLKK